MGVSQNVSSLKRNGRALTIATKVLTHRPPHLKTHHGEAQSSYAHIPKPKHLTKTKTSASKPVLRFRDTISRSNQRYP